MNKLEKYYNFTERSQSREAKSRSATEEIPPLNEYESSFECSQEPATGHWGQMNPVVFLTPYFI